eukprot:CAMPEP_0202899216 /NCGR_PEP_ID=MMETSP1392-20130828/7510_1 /ASSEMBLY_ACC=CAM_ASM_000868 /TAXON_ID=225041 /ORGANISM="Chlamydomonas chlamydogama, Strain SAG 11-48b" /LENGTH=475 /DNA_ID=CAMNT_0049585339 /DNA_START=83 /DNA_END=1507 /DNA_ORIENTATION=+
MNSAQRSKLKHSPSLLFSILTEADESRVTEKLRSVDVNAHGKNDTAATVKTHDSCSELAGAAKAKGTYAVPGSSEGSDSTDTTTTGAEDATQVAAEQKGVTDESMAEADINATLQDISAEFVLQELLGDLFIHPNQLEFESLLGEGAFATVHKCSFTPAAHNASAGCPAGLRMLVAVKRLKPEVLQGSDDLKEFLTEANLLRKLKHSNIVSIRGIGAAELQSLDAARRSMYVVMEAMEGGNLKFMVLRQMTSRSAVYTGKNALQWCMHIAEAMTYLHEVCKPMIIHRDIKLENVLLSGGSLDLCVAKLADFGLHKRAKVNPNTGALTAPDFTFADASVHARSIHDERSYYGGSAFYAGAKMNASRHGSAHKPSSSALPSGSFHNPQQQQAAPLQHQLSLHQQALQLAQQQQQHSANPSRHQAGSATSSLHGSEHGGTAALEALHMAGHTPQQSVHEGKARQEGSGHGPPISLLQA